MIWKIIKGIINRNRKFKVNERFKLNDGSETTDSKVISNKLNDFFVYVGPSLANEISHQYTPPEHYSRTEHYIVFILNQLLRMIPYD